MARNAQEQRTVHDCLEAARKMGEWGIIHTPEPGRGQPPSDCRVDLRGAWGCRAYACVVFGGLSAQTLPIVLHRAGEIRAAGHTPLLMSRHVNPALATRLRDLNVEFIDAVGNAYLRGEGLYVWVTGKRSEARPQRRPRIFRPVGLKLAYVLLRDPGSVNWTYRRLAAAAGIALGSVGWMIRDLHELGYLERVGPRKRRLTRLQSLRERWEVAYGESLRPRLLRQVCRVTGHIAMDTWVDRLREVAERNGILIGGELGAALATGGLRHASVVLHSGARDLGPVLKELGLLPDADGGVAILDVFGEENEWIADAPKGMRLADPLLLRAEALLDADDRLLSVARELLESYIAPRMDR